MELFEPTQNLMIVKIIPQSTQTAGGIHLIEGAQPLSPLIKGEVLKVGPGYMQPDGEYTPMRIKVGDCVTFIHGGLVISSSSEGEYKIMKEEEIIGVFKEEALKNLYPDNPSDPANAGMM